MFGMHRQITLMKFVLVVIVYIMMTDLLYIISQRMNYLTLNFLELLLIKSSFMALCLSVQVAV